MAIVAVLCFVAGAIVCWKWTHRESRLFSYTLPVVKVENGATLQVQHGLLGRRTRPVMIEGISAPGLNDHLGPESKENLQELAGATIRLTSTDRPIGAGLLVGTVWGDTGQDLGLAQLRAGLATCQTGATKDQFTAQKQAQTAKRGLWETTGGSHWWHFSAPNSSFPEPFDEEPEAEKMFDLQTVGNALLIGVAVIALVWILWAVLAAKVATKAPTTAAVVTGVVDTSEQLAAYAALTAVRHTPAVAADPKAVENCDYLRAVCTQWPAAKK